MSLMFHAPVITAAVVEKAAMGLFPPVDHARSADGPVDMKTRIRESKRYLHCWSRGRLEWTRVLALSKNRIGTELSELRSRLTQVENLLATQSHMSTMPSLVSTASVDIPLPLDLNVVTSQNGQNGMGENQWSPFSTLRADLDMNNGPLPAAGPSTARLPLAELSGPRQKRSRVDDRVSPGSPSSQDHMERVERADRLKRAADGRLRHYGPISIWSQKHSDAGQFGDSPPPDLVAPPTSWASNLPPELFIDQATHDLAMERFSAYYAPWCVVADMPGFTADLDLICKDPLAPSRTMVYSPLLHCTSLFLGLCLLHRQPTRETWDLFQHHCLNLLRRECANMTISTLLAINLLSSCMHFDAEVGYLYFGMAVAAVQTVSSRVRNRSRSYVERGEMTSGEQSARDTAMGTLYLQDVLRAVGFGRSPMFPASYAGVLPPIDASMDAEPWLLPSDLVATTNPAIRRLAGLPSTRSTVLHWTARLGVILRAVIDNLSMQQRSDDNSQAVEENAPMTLGKFQEPVQN
ncbi:hypothetical protein I317_07782 [Kwoniella heveanensis CBS 569]|nr:hypothetical protein I317_07782 [Kwoniella heveanensis CBS 569]